MNQITRCDWLPERARCMEPSCPLGTTRCIPQAKFHQKQYNKSFIDQVCSVKMAGYWPRSFFCDFMDLDFVSVHKHAKKNLANLQPSWPHTGSITHTYDTDLASSWVLDQSECAQGPNLIYIEIVNNKKKQTHRNRQKKYSKLVQLGSKAIYRLCLNKIQALRVMVLHSCIFESDIWNGSQPQTRKQRCEINKRYTTPFLRSSFFVGLLCLGSVFATR